MQDEFSNQLDLPEHTPLWLKPPVAFTTKVGEASVNPTPAPTPTP